jgi:hypothetical protein
MKNFFKRILRVLTGIAIFAIMSAMFGVAVMLLWNWLLPPLFGFPSINYLQAVGLFILPRILFGGIGGGYGRHLFGDYVRHNNPFREKWLKMTEEERNEFWKHHHRSFR